MECNVDGLYDTEEEEEEEGGSSGLPADTVSAAQSLEATLSEVGTGGLCRPRRLRRIDSRDDGFNVMRVTQKGIIRQSLIGGSGAGEEVRGGGGSVGQTCSRRGGKD